MTHRNIDAAREARLWIGQVIVPAVASVILLASNPDVRWWAKEKIDRIKNTKIRFTFKNRGR